MPGHIFKKNDLNVNYEGIYPQVINRLSTELRGIGALKMVNMRFTDCFILCKIISMLNEKEFYKKLANSIARRRYSLKMNQAAIVKKLKKSRQSISSLENGNRGIDCYELFLISKVLDISIGELFKEALGE